MQITGTGSPRPNYTARDFSSLLVELQSYVQQTRPDLAPDFFATASLGELLIELVAVEGDIVSFSLDQAATQFFLSSATRYSTGLRWAASVGYVPRTSASASVSVQASSLPPPVQTYGATIPAGSSLTGPNGTSFFTEDAVVIAASSTSLSLTLIEGAPHSDTFSATNLAYLTLTTSAAIVAQGSWSVYVGDPTNPSNLWAQVANVGLEISATQTYSISFDAQGHLVVQFGNGTNGQIPSSPITIQYNTTDGSLGNVPAQGLIGNMLATLTGIGSQVAISFSNAAASTGGSDRETLAELQVNIPSYIRSGGKLVDILDYSSAPLQVNGVGNAFAMLDIASYAANIVDVSVWGEQAGQFTVETQSPNSFTSTTPYTPFTVAGNALVADVQDYLRGITAVGVLPNVLSAPLAFADVYINAMTYDSRYSPATLQTAIAAAVVGVFQGGTGFDIRLSDLYNAIRSLGGVIYFTIDRIVFQYQSTQRATGTVTFSGGLQPLDGDTVWITDGSNGSNPFVFEFDDDGIVGDGHVPVPIGLSAQQTMASLVSVVNGNCANIVAVNDNTNPPECFLQQQLGGTSYNYPILSLGILRRFRQRFRIGQRKRKRKRKRKRVGIRFWFGREWIYRVHRGRNRHVGRYGCCRHGD